MAEQLENYSPEDILAWACETFGDKLTMGTAFGAEGCVLLAMLSQIDNRAFIFNLDTGYQFPETLELRERIMAKYGMQVHLVRAAESVEQMEARFKGPIYGTDPDTCCNIRKVVPQKLAVKGYDAWISAIRRDQSPMRANAPIVAWDKRFEVVKVNPLAKWSKKEVWNYIFSNGVPYNPLHDQGYPSIGCQPCTHPVGAGDDEREGRWAGKSKTECGLHAATV